MTGSLRRGIAAVAIVAATACSDPGPSSYVGSAACASCHAAETAAWQGSHHDLAMQEAGDSTVLGDFSGVEFAYFGRKSRFFRDGQRFLVRTEDAEGRDRDFEVTHTFGVTPLQQYLVPFPGGRMQALPVAWDARPAEVGGQRWYHLYPEEPIVAGDPLHWTGPFQNWNTMCAACHSTGLRKNYDAATDSFATTWKEIDVACEACHGPGSRHVAWAEASDSTRWPARGALSSRDLGLEVDLDRPSEFVVDASTGSARPLRSRPGDPRIDVCAACHSRRSERVDGPAPGAPYHDAFRLSRLDEGLYFADGQIEDEVYVYGSFLQSRMHAAGVVCADCHDTHSLRLRAPGNAVCARCHLPDRFDVREHHGHDPGQAGGLCVSCHMPSRTYMGVDPRLDHSLRVPRPGLAARIGAPDVCTGCHPDRGPEWAVQAVRSWGYDAESPHYGDVIAAGRAGLPGAEAGLAALAADSTASDLVRATAFDLLGRYPGRTAFDALRAAAADPSIPVRLAAVEGLQFADLPTRASVLLGVLDDPSDAVRSAAGRLLAGLEASAIDAKTAARLDRAIESYVAAELAMAERPEARQNVALVRQAQGRLDEAEAGYRDAIRLGPWFTPGYANLADLLRSRGDAAGAQAVLRQGIERAADPAPLHHALGLLLARGGRLPEAIDALRAAVTAAPGRVDFAYVLGVALNESGDANGALDVLREAHERFPRDTNLLQALATISRDAGRREEAIRWAERLADLLGPGGGAQALLYELRK